MSFQAYKYEIRRLPPPTFFTSFMVAEVVYCSLDIQIAKFLSAFLQKITFVNLFKSSFIVGLIFLVPQ